MGQDHGVADHVTTIFKVPLFFLALLVFLFISLLTGQTQMTLLLVLILGILILTKLWSRFAFSGLVLKTRIDRTRVFPGEEISFDILAGNHKFLPVWVQVKLPWDKACFFPALETGETGPVENGTGESRFCENFFLLGFQEIKFSWKLKSLKRGCFSLGHTHTLAGDLLGFFPRSRKSMDFLEVIVFPKILKIKPFPLPQRFYFGIPGRQSPVQDPVYILGTREYQGFTPAKFIHWKASARYDKLQEKICEPSVQEKILLVVDVDLFHGQKAAEAFEHMLETAASMAVYFEARGNAVGFMTNGVIKGGKPGVVPILGTRQNLSMIFETLARMEMKPGKLLLDIFHGQNLGGLSCIYCTLCMDPSLVRVKQFFDQKRIPIKYVVAKAGEGENISGSDIQHMDSICHSIYQ